MRSAREALLGTMVLALAIGPLSVEMVDARSRPVIDQLVQLVAKRRTAEDWIGRLLPQTVNDLFPHPLMRASVSV
jgi:hypothetical protein